MVLLLLQKRMIFFKNEFFLHILGYDSWLLFGDFNFIRKISETTGSSYQYAINNKFNQFIYNENLMELQLIDRQFTWAKSCTFPTTALLDRFLCSISWNNHFNTTIVKSIPGISSNHNPIILCSNVPHLPKVK
jgi:hypothetical protein